MLPPDRISHRARRGRSAARPRSAPARLATSHKDALHLMSPSTRTAGFALVLLCCLAACSAPAGPPRAPGGAGGSLAGVLGPLPRGIFPGQPVLRGGGRAA